MSMFGSHTFQVTHPKGEIFSTNWFNWYGEYNLGKIDLKRTKGTLAIAVDPPAPLLSIRGPEWSLITLPAAKNWPWLFNRCRITGKSSNCSWTSKAANRNRSNG